MSEEIVWKDPPQPKHVARINWSEDFRHSLDSLTHPARHGTQFLSAAEAPE